ncbi:hypothetical protein XA68_11410 [Ophiocordyceps unilateralis]|uniref:Chromatin assembly factor 1 subunit p150 C-terminal domain-containing protein n=1 Tax=Ophiocordyceps unilateralis TaxID=268505 RepID=A0A2A9PGX7_OPHUN|nr:hypothetical protein XA68_11410 [Ophiocordyceps unilateralis]
MEANIQETEAAGRKRSHTEFAGDLEKPESDAETKKSAPANVSISQNPAQSPSLPPSPQSASETTSPKQFNHDKQSVSPSAATSKATASATKPAPQRKRLSAEEKQAREKDKAQKQKEKEVQAALRAADKARQEEEKVARAKEREEKRKKKEEEDMARAEKKRKKEEEQRRMQEDRDKKARSQTRLNSFFRLPNTPKKTAAEPGSHSASPVQPGAVEAASKPVLSAYDQLFKPFYVRDNTVWTRVECLLDEDTRKARSDALDDYISGHREPRDQSGLFDVAELLHLRNKPPKRGRLHHPVKHIMEKALKETSQSGTDVRVAASSIPRVRQRLAQVPMKVIAFSQDVRPPYRGTMTLKPFNLGVANWRKLARKTTGRLLPLDYDYDSEAEWQEEEGEDVDVDDEDEEQDDDDDMDGFLDDSEDVGLSRRVFANTMEPESSGICFEDGAGHASIPALSEFRMEFIHGGLQRDAGVDPWSTQYWEPEEKRKSTKSGNSARAASKMAPPKAPGTPFEPMNDQKAGSKMVKAEHLDEVKRLILEHRELPKGSIVDIIFHRFRNKQSSVSRVEVKNTVDMIAEKKGAGRSKEWGLRAGFEIKL